MKIGAALNKMISFSGNNSHDINHFLKVFAFAKSIGELEGLDADTQEILELAAVVHDIACPLCREKYGNTNGKYQEIEGVPLARQFLRELSVSDLTIDRVAWLVGHHHSYTNVEGLDYQILLEADFLVNADEGSMSQSAIQSMLKRVFKTETGKRMLQTIYLCNE
ncbi:MAG: phosphohydrolase [Spirochaetaceae bacterium 4572_59]|nr:MAG: phosphohydrolase [Spirochaetaceae bacterium 4572_59]